MHPGGKSLYVLVVLETNVLSVSLFCKQIALLLFLASTIMSYRDTNTPSECDTAHLQQDSFQETPSFFEVGGAQDLPV